MGFGFWVLISLTCEGCVNLDTFKIFLELQNSTGQLILAVFLYGGGARFLGLGFGFLQHVRMKQNRWVGPVESVASGTIIMLLATK